MKHIFKKCITTVLAMASALCLTTGLSTAKAAEDTAEIKIVMADGLQYQQYHGSSKELLLNTKIHKIGDEWGYCIAMWKSSHSGSAKKINIKTYLPGDELVYACLAQKHIFEDNLKTKDLPKKEKYAYTQCMIWWIQRDHILDGSWRQFVVGGALSESQQRTLYSDLEKQIKAEASKYEGDGVAYRNVDVEDDQEIGIIFAPKLKTGTAKLKKVSSDPIISGSNNCYSLSDTAYNVYSDENCKTKVAALTTDAIGNSNTVELETGTYYVRETKAPKGFRTDPAVHSVTVESGKTATVTVSDSPKFMNTSIELSKLDLETQKSSPQGNAALADAQFEWKFYAGYYEKDSLPSSPAKRWITKTKEKTSSDGNVHYVTRLDNDHKVSGDDFYMQNGTVVLPLGTLTVEEIHAPKGYLLDGAYLQAKDSDKKITGLYITQIKENGETASLSGGNTYSVSDQIIRGGIKIKKRDLETKLDKAQGGATLENAEFAIINKSKHPVLVGGKLYSKDQIIMTITTDKSGTAKTAADVLPYGSYHLTEVTPPEGYLHEGTLDRDFEITENGIIVDLTDASRSILNQVKRGDLKMLKIADGSSKRLAGVPFKIISKTTGEAHVIVTDDNGYASTSNDWNPHTHNTNQGKNPEDGIWFNGYNDEKTGAKPDNTLGALPYDTYLIEEQPCKANEGKTLIPAFEVILKRHDHTIDLGTITNDNKPKALISKTDAATGKQIEGASLKLYKKDNHDWTKIAETVTTKDVWTVEVEPGDYKLTETMAPTGYLISEAVEFSVAEGVSITQVEMKDKPIEISGNIDKKQTLVDKNGTYFYTLDYCSTSNTWADELNVTDPLESVNAGYTRLLSIQTPVSFDDYNAKMNIWYQTNKTDPKDTSVSDVYNACRDNPENPANPKNERMTDYTGWKIWKADVSTLESQKLNVSELPLGEDEYVTAFRFEHGRIEEGFTTRKQDTPELDKIKSEHDNLPETVSPHDTTFNLKDAANTALQEDREIHYAPAVLEMKVVSEEFKTKEIELWNSAQMNVFRNKGVTDKLRDEDEDKVVQAQGEISIHTTATNKADGTKILNDTKKARIVDTVTMKGLDVGKEYVLKGWQMVREKDEKLLVDGRDVTDEVTFTADKEDMQVQLSFAFDASGLGNQKLVTFEELYESSDTKSPVSEHKNINNKEQTVSITDKPEETSKISSPVKTGDNAPLLLYGILALVSLLSATGIVIFIYRRRNK